jgi:hypothetical protein
VLLHPVGGGFRDDRPRPFAVVPGERLRQRRVHGRVGLGAFEHPLELFLGGAERVDADRLPLRVAG